MGYYGFFFLGIYSGLEFLFSNLGVGVRVEVLWIVELVVLSLELVAFFLFKSSRLV